jgi:putative Mg2+ transporter-C (MgtC) family protein
VTAVHADLLLRILVGTVLGAVIGYERRMHGRPAGLRTHLIVALASSTFMVVSTHFVYFQTYKAGDLVAVDPSRIAASVVTGVGFLGGGAILRTGVNVQGLTTAAGLWLVAAIGLSAGAGMYVVSTFSTLLGVVALTVLRRLEHKDDGQLVRRISLTLGREAPPLSAILAALQARKMVVSPAPYEKRVDETSVEITFQARIPADAGEELVQILESQPGLRRVRVDVPS